MNKATKDHSTNQLHEAEKIDEEAYGIKMRSTNQMTCEMECPVHVEMKTRQTTIQIILQPHLNNNNIGSNINSV